MSVTSDYPTVVRWFRQLLAGQPHQIIGGSDNPYLRRWYVIPRNPWFNVYVHHFLRSDDDRALHDHPWWFVSLILREGYVEISENADGQTTMLCRTSVFDVRSPFWLRCIAFRPATYRHRVQLPISNDGIEQPCWTLIVTGRRSREWGFWCKRQSLFLQRRAGDRFVPWRQFDDAGCGEH